jgi:hypothetical protein
MEYQTLIDFITSEESSWKTKRIPLTDSKDWSMYEHIQRCKNVANGWFHTGKNDGERPYDDLVTPIIDVAFRTEGFDVKDIQPYVNDAENYYKSFLVKKFHPRWAKKNELDTIIDKAVETSIIYDLVIFKNVDGVPEVQPLEDIAFCDQADVLSGPLCFKKNYSPSELLNFKGKWDDEKIDEAILMARKDKVNVSRNQQKTHTPGKYIEVYLLYGSLREDWLKEDGDPDKYVDSFYAVSFYTKADGEKDKVILYKGKSDPIDKMFDALKIDQVRSHGRACGKSIVERMFEPQVWNNYSSIKIKEKLDAAVDLFISDSEEIGNQKLSQLPKNTILKQERGANTTRLNGEIKDMDKYMAHKDEMKQSARLLGSAGEAQLGVNPSSGTPFKLQDLVVQQGQGIHEYRQGKISTFFADRIYPKWTLPAMVKEMNQGDRWLDELTLEELQYVAEAVATKSANKKAVKLVLEKKPEDEITQEEVNDYREMVKQEWMQGGNKRFLEAIKDELKNLPVNCNVNIAGKQAYLAQQADKLTNFIRAIIQNPQAFAQMPGLGKSINELAEKSGLNPIDFNFINQPLPAQPMNQSAMPEMAGQQ